jgi:hypothetical protein
MATIDNPTEERRKWTIEKSHRRCPNYHCQGHDRPTSARVVVNARTGVIKGKCSTCEKPFEYQAHKYSAVKRCNRCPVERRVTVSVWTNGRGSVQHHWNNYCTACVLEISANEHIRQANAHRAKAAVIRARRANRKPGAPAATEDR